MNLMRGQHIFTTSQMGENAVGKAISRTSKSIKIREENNPYKMLAISDHLMRAELEHNSTLVRTEKPQREKEQE